jgi:hypothetical protein
MPNPASNSRSSKSKSRKSESSNPKERRKYCHCSPTCGHFISKRTRRDHYSKIHDPSTIEPSESEYESEPELDGPPSPMQLDEPLPFRHDSPIDYTDVDALDTDSIPNDDLMEVDMPAQMVTYSDLDSESELDDIEHGLDLDELSDADDWKDFDEVSDVEEPLTREEMVRQLEEILGSDEEGALWDRRAYFPTLSTLIYRC